jgi:hypothetical protein
MDTSISPLPLRPAPDVPTAAAARIQRLPFVVRPARDDRDLANIVALRQEAWGRHLPELARSMDDIEPRDRCPSTLMLLAEDREDGRVLGSMRLPHNTLGPLVLEASIELPAQLRREHLVEAARLGIVQGAPAEVRWALFKAGYCHCLETGVHSMLVSARRSLARIYAGLMFKDLFEPGATYPMKHVDGLPHRVMAFRIGEAERLWQSHPMRAYMADTLHPDIRWEIDPCQQNLASALS